MLITNETIRKHLHGMYLLKNGRVYGRVKVNVISGFSFTPSFISICYNGKQESLLHPKLIFGYKSDCLVSTLNTDDIDSYNLTARIMRANNHYHYSGLSDEEIIREAIMHRMYMSLYNNYRYLGIAVQDKIKLVTAEKLTLYDLC